MKEYTVEVAEDGSKAWYLKGQRHREDGPAVERSDGSKGWYRDGKLHREDGPALKWPSGAKEWWLDGELITDEEHKRRTSGVTMNDALAAGDGVILREQAARIKELEDQNKELLEALEKLERTASLPTMSYSARVAARAAIAKAKGDE